TVAAGAWIYGNFIGTDPTGTQLAGNGRGVGVYGGAAHILIGTNGDGVDDVRERNVISGNSLGVYISGYDEAYSNLVGTTHATTVAGNFIGPDVTGRSALGNYFGGVYIGAGASANWIGVSPFNGSVVGNEGNVISGNASDAVAIQGGDSNFIAGNLIGTDV